MFTIIICTYNGERTLAKTIESVLAQEKYDELVEQFIVVDNASTDSSCQIIKQYGDKGILYSYESNQGLSWARLNGVEKTQAEWIVFIDDDNELDCNWLKNAASFIETNNQISLFGGTIIPKVDFDITDKERANLYGHLTMLACNTDYRNNIDFGTDKSPAGCIFGAGMVVKSFFLQKLVHDGWLIMEGRKADNTEAGDDGEIVSYVLRHGGIIGYCPHMIIEHNLPRFRLQDDYLLKLGKSLAVSVYRYQSLQPYYILRRVKTVGLYCVKWNPHKKGSLDRALWNQKKRVYFNMLLKDLFFKR